MHTHLFVVVSLVLVVNSLPLHPPIYVNLQCTKQHIYYHTFWV